MKRQKFASSITGSSSFLCLFRLGIRHPQDHDDVGNEFCRMQRHCSLANTDWAWSQSQNCIKFNAHFASVPKRNPCGIVKHLKVMCQLKMELKFEDEVRHASPQRAGLNFVQSYSCAWHSSLRRNQSCALKESIYE